MEPGTQRRKKQRARLVPGGELSGKSEAEIPLDAARPEDGEAAPNKRPRVTEEAAPAHQRPLSGSAFDPVPNTNSNSGDEGDKDLQRHCCDELSPAAIQGSKAMAGVPVPIFVPVKTVSAQDILTGAHLRRSGNSSAPASDPSSTTSWVVRVGEKPKTAEEAGAWGPPRTNVFKRAPPPITFKGFTPPQQPANQSAVSPTNHPPCLLIPRLHLRCQPPRPTMARTHACHTVHRDSTATQPRGGGRWDTRGLSGLWDRHRKHLRPRCRALASRITRADKHHRAPPHSQRLRSAVPARRAHGAQGQQPRRSWAQTAPGRSVGERGGQAPRRSSSAACSLEACSVCPRRGPKRLPRRRGGRRRRLLQR